MELTQIFAVAMLIIAFSVLFFILFVMAPSIHWFVQQRVRWEIIRKFSEGTTVEQMFKEATQEIEDRPWQVRLLERMGLISTPPRAK